MIVGLVSCSALKLDRAAPARELYRSALFRLSLAYAIPRTDAVYVVSAKHGLVELDQVLDPYDLRLDALPRRERLAWGAGVVAELARRHGRCGAMVLAGATYEQALRANAGDELAPLYAPLCRMQLGERLSFLSRVTGANAARLRRDRERCAALSRCTTCRKRQAADGLSTCDVCLDRKYERDRAKRLGQP